MSGYFARLAARAAGAAPPAAITPASSATMPRQPVGAGPDPFEATAVADAVIPASSHPAVAAPGPAAPVGTVAPPVSYDATT